MEIKKMGNNLIQDRQQKHDYCSRINDMHYPEVEAVRSVRIPFSEKIHDAKLKKSRPENNIPGRTYLLPATGLLYTLQRFFGAPGGCTNFIIKPTVFKDLPHGVVKMTCNHQITETAPFIVHFRRQRSHTDGVPLDRKSVVKGTCV